MNHLSRSYESFPDTGRGRPCGMRRLAALGPPCQAAVWADEGARRSRQPRIRPRQTCCPTPPRRTRVRELCCPLRQTQEYLLLSKLPTRILLNRPRHGKHDATRRAPAHRRKAYSPNSVEGFSDVRALFLCPEAHTTLEHRLTSLT